MYFLTKFCRICITSNENLREIDSCDYDSIKISEKLKVFTKTASNMENWSAFICPKCVRKLRVSYEFDRMCKKSSVILKQYLVELFSCTNNNTVEKFTNSELRLQLEKVPQRPHKRKYIKREKRCSLLKDLLTKIRNDQKYFQTNPLVKPTQLHSSSSHRKRNIEGGLRSLLQFTRSYNYGYRIENNRLESVKFDRTPLERLTDFVNNYFKLNLDRFHERISCVLEESEEWFEEADDLEEMIKPCKEDFIKYEEVIVEPDINIKKEVITDDIEDENMEFEVSYACSSMAPQIKIEKVQIKTEPQGNMVSETDLMMNQFMYGQSSSDNSFAPRNNSEIYPTLCESLGRGTQSSLNLLKEYTETTFTNHNRPGHSILERPKRGRAPFISPQLKKQFLYQDFKCGVCNRRFKSQGYLQAHCSKMKHKPY